MVVMAKTLSISLVLCVFLGVTIAQPVTVVLQNGTGGYNGCEDQLLIMDERTSGYMVGYEAPDKPEAVVCYYRC